MPWWDHRHQYKIIIVMMCKGGNGLCTELHCTGIAKSSSVAVAVVHDAEEEEVQTVYIFLCTTVVVVVLLRILCNANVMMIIWRFV